MTETGPPTDTIVYKICPRADWLAACRDAVYAGAPIDRRDGFIHLSTAAQVRETAAKHFAVPEKQAVTRATHGLGRCGATHPESTTAAHRCRRVLVHDQRDFRGLVGTAPV